MMMDVETLTAPDGMSSATRKNRLPLPPRRLPTLGRITSLQGFFDCYPLGGERHAVMVEPPSRKLAEALIACGVMDMTIPDASNAIVPDLKASNPGCATIRKARGPSIFDLRTNRGFDLWCDPGHLARLSSHDDHHRYVAELRKRLRFGGYAVIACRATKGNHGPAMSVSEMSGLFGLYFELHAVLDPPVSLGRGLKLAIFRRWAGSTGRR